jgi:hypothetical protein
MGFLGADIPNPLDKGADSPDYMGAADKETRANRPDQSNPYGSSNWLEGPNGQWSQSSQFNPMLSGANDEMMQQLHDAWSKPLDNGQQARDKAEGALYDRATSRLNPEFGRRETSMNTSLAQQGIDMNGDPNSAYGGAHDTFNRGRNDAYNQAMFSAITGGGEEGERAQRMDLTSRMAPLGAMSGLKGLLSQAAVPRSGNYGQAASNQGDFNLQRQTQDRGFWSDAIGGATGGAKSMGGKGGASGLAMPGGMPPPPP